MSADHGGVDGPSAFDNPGANGQTPGHSGNDANSVNPADLTPAELRAVEDHKYFLSQRLGREATIGEAIQDFVEFVRPEWLRRKVSEDNRSQISHMEWFKFCEAVEKGRAINVREAANEWITRYAQPWREWRDGLEQNGFLRVTVTAWNPDVFHMRPAGTVAHIASRFECDVYMHKANMSCYNFRLRGRPYVHVKSIILMLSIGIKAGDVLEFIATGREARAALDAIVAFVGGTDGEGGSEKHGRL